MTKDEALKLALEALEADELDMVDDGNGNMVFRKEQALTAIKEALAQPKQEPLAWISTGPASMIHWTADKPAYVQLLNDPNDNYGCAVPSTSSGLKLAPGVTHSMQYSVVTTDSIAVYGATTGDSWYCQYTT